MTMLSFPIMVILSILTAQTFAQPNTELPPKAAISHFVLPISYYKTTVLIFPSAIDTADRGSSGIIAEKQTKLENVLKVKAAYQGFSPTNLHIFTVDHRMYAFEVTYSDSPSATTFDLSKLTSGKDGSNTAPTLVYSKRSLTNNEWMDLAKLVKNQPRTFFVRSKREGIQAELESIYLWDRKLLFSFSITNKTNLPFTMGYTDFELSDRRKMRRSSVQERHFPITYSDSLIAISGKSTIQWFAATDQFTVPRSRVVRWQVGENNGERLISLRVKNRYLFKVKNLSRTTASYEK